MTSGSVASPESGSGQLDFSRRYFASISRTIDADHLRVWDSISGRLTAHHAFAGDVRTSCIAWVRIAPRHAAGKRAQPSEGSRAKAESAIAVGCADGQIMLFAPKDARVIGRMDDSAGGHTMAVNSIVADPDRLSFFSCSDDGFCIHWTADAVASSKWKLDGAPVFRLAVSPNGEDLAIGQFTISIWNMATSSVRMTMPGHPDGVSHLSFTAGGGEVVSAGESDRFINVWSAASATSAPISTSLLFTLPLDEAPITLDLCADPSAATSTFIASACKNGLVYLWALPDPSVPVERPKKSKKTATSSHASIRSILPTTSIRIVEKSASTGATIPILAAAFVRKADLPLQLLTVRGLSLAPEFEAVAILEPKNGRMIGEPLVLQRVRQDNLFLSSAPRIASKNAAGKVAIKNVEVIGSNPMVAGGSLKILNDDGELAQLSVVSNGGTARGDNRGDKDLVDAETIRQAVESLTTADDKQGRSELPKSMSLVQILCQALHSSDRHLLETALSVTDTSVITASIRRMPNPFVLPLLQAIVSRIERRPARGVVLIGWLRLVLTIHSGYLITVPDLSRKLSGLYRTVDSRVAVYEPLLQLSGRLDLVLAQVTLRNSVADEDPVITEPAVIYQEEDGESGSDGEMEDESEMDDEMDGEMDDEMDGEMDDEMDGEMDEEADEMDSDPESSSDNAEDDDE